MEKDQLWDHIFKLLQRYYPDGLHSKQDVVYLVGEAMKFVSRMHVSGRDKKQLVLDAVLMAISLIPDNDVKALLRLFVESYGSDMIEGLIYLGVHVQKKCKLCCK